MKTYTFVIDGFLTNRLKKSIKVQLNEHNTSAAIELAKKRFPNLKAVTTVKEKPEFVLEGDLNPLEEVGFDF